MTAIESAKIDAEQTRQRILEAAELVFAARGREAASIRDILKQAGVKNIAAINYHFGDKDSLYIAVVKNAHASCCIMPFPDWPAGTPPLEKLRGYVRTMIARMLAPARTSALQVMMREMTQPSEACAEVVREYIQPMARILEGILKELRPDLKNPQRFLIGNSVVAQCLFYRQNRPIIEQLMGADMFQQLSVDVLTDHITSFTLKALGLKVPAAR
jgi:AcrR family transcriptional regulator